MTLSIPLIDIPFALRHICWFCAEPYHCIFEYQAKHHTPHPSLAVPCCKECLTLAKQHQLTSIWECQLAVKDELMLIYAKHLSIGINWTEQELIDSEFSCKVFAGFKKSGWMMYLIARDRINAPSWPITIEGVPIETHEIKAGFEFDGIKYATLSKAMQHYSETLGLDKSFFHAIVSLVGRARFAYAVRLCRINIASNKRTNQQVLRDLALEHTDTINDPT